jgi:hypothetical protein
MPSAGKAWRLYDNLVPGAVDFADALGGAPYSGYATAAHKNYPNHVGYAHAYIKAASNQSAQLWLGYNDGIKVWLNGKGVHTEDRNYTWERNKTSDVVPDEKKIKISLASGWNRLLLKVSQDSGKAIPNLTCSAVKQ